MAYQAVSKSWLIWKLILLNRNFPARNRNPNRNSYLFLRTSTMRLRLGLRVEDYEYGNYEHELVT